MIPQVYNEDAERAVLAACLTSKLARTEARRHIAGPDLYHPVHERIWDAMGRLDRHGKPVDPVTLAATIPTDRDALQLLPELVSVPTIPEDVADHAALVRGWGIKRRLAEEGVRVTQQAGSPETNAAGLAASFATRFAAIRDSGLTDDVTARTLAEVLADVDDEPDWLIPGMFERRDRLILTGEEGLGKSYLMRQIVVLAAAGLHPWDVSRIPPVRSMIFDCENSERQIRRKARPLTEFAARHGEDPAERVMVVCSRRVDITRDKDLASIHRELDAAQPDLLTIGPLYRLTSRAIQTDDEAAPVLAALDTIRDRGITLLIEAHSGHAIGRGGHRDVRPRGSSALLGWPEFGYGMRDIGTRGYADFVAWRGNRDERDWPQRLRIADGFRWVPHEDSTDYSGWSPSKVIA